MKFYFGVILPLINYGLVLRGLCCNSELINSIERLHSRAARIIFNLFKDMASSEIMKTVNCSKIKLSHKLEIFKSMCKPTHTKIYYLTVYAEIYYYSLRGHEVTAIHRHKSRFMKDSLAYRGLILWNLLNYNLKITNVGC